MSRQFEYFTEDAPFIGECTFVHTFAVGRYRKLPKLNKLITKEWPFSTKFNALGILIHGAGFKKLGEIFHVS